MRRRVEKLAKRIVQEAQQGGNKKDCTEDAEDEPASPTTKSTKSKVSQLLIYLI